MFSKRIRDMFTPIGLAAIIASLLAFDQASFAALARRKLIPPKSRSARRLLLLFIRLIPVPKKP
jgi:hypothetical protein